MINISKEKNLLSEDKWPKVTSVFVKGIPEETNIDADFPVDQKPTRSQTWKNIAVIRVTANKPTKFYIGFANMGTIEYLLYEMKTDIEYGMRIGGGDVRYFALPIDLSKTLKLELVEITNEEDPKYKDLFLI